VCSSCIGLDGSSCLSDANILSVAEVFPEDWEEGVTAECDSTGVSKNGSLGARARFGWTVEAAIVTDFCSNGSGWEWERACIVGESGKIP
jgi:hypothetical protein